MTAIGLAILIVSLTVSFGIGGVLLGHRLIRRHVAAYHNEVMISLFATAGVIYAVLLAFLVVVVWEAYDSAHHNLGEEASTLIPFYRLTYGMEAQHGAASRKLIRQYTNAVIHDEWPTLGQVNAGSAKARRAIGDLDRQFAVLDPAVKKADSDVDAQFLNYQSIIVTDRNQRLLKASDTVPWVMWLGAIGGGLIVMVMGFFVFMERVWPHAIMTALAYGLIGLLLFMMVALSEPYTGPLALGPGHFEQALVVMDDIDRGQ